MHKPQGVGNVVSLDRPAEWKDFGLGWDPAEHTQSGNVVVAQFPRNEDK